MPRHPRAPCTRRRPTRHRAADAAYPPHRVETMAMVCPQCSTTFEQSAHCPNCGVRLLYRSRRRRGDSHEGESAQWVHTPTGRIIAGILLAQGLAYGLQLLCIAMLQATDGSHDSVWSTIFGLVLLQAIQAISLLIGGAVAGAG